jgi:phosphoribosylglycinamide formyltransferase-1
MATSIRLGILASGTGTNFDAIADAIADGRLKAEIHVLVCNRPQAAVAGKAERRGIRVSRLNHADYESREDFDCAVADILQQSAVELVVMAGFDRLVTPALLSRFPRRVINIHPALLPAFKGLDAQGQAAEYGVKLAGATVHIVDEKVDHGPIVIQSAVPVFADDDAESVRLRILAREHEIYPYAIQLFAENRIRVEGRSISIDGKRGDASTHLTAPPIDWKRD